LELADKFIYFAKIAFQMNRIILLIPLILFTFSPSIRAQELADSVVIQPINKKMRASAILTESAVYVAGMSYLQFVWYKDKDRVPFHFQNDNAGYLQMDKLGHAYSAYTESYVGYTWLRKAGISKGKALLYGGSLGFILQAPIEIWDGMYGNWGFSWGDVIANTAGCALFVGQELLFDEQILRFKMSVSKSEFAGDNYGYYAGNLAETLLGDYNGQTYWLSMNANKLFLKDKLPPWLNIAVGYSADGLLGHFENEPPYDHIDRTRQFVLSLDVDWQKIPTHSKFLKALFYGLNFIKIPFPALEVNSQGKLKGHLFYFCNDSGLKNYS
jgi:uncharacterized protein YfiM (DUF2279 family)